MLTVASNISGVNKSTPSAHTSFELRHIFLSCELWFVAVLMASPAHQDAERLGRKGFQSVPNTHPEPTSSAHQALKTFTLSPGRVCSLGSEGETVCSFSFTSHPYLFLNRIPLKCLGHESSTHFLFRTQMAPCELWCRGIPLSSAT